jgi:hypothetical protein
MVRISKKYISVGFGIYTRAVESKFSDKPVPPKGLTTLKEALQRLGIEVAKSHLEKDYREGRTTQIPAGQHVAVNNRVRRKIGYNDIFLTFERT